MPQTITHIDTQRSILWAFNNPEMEKVCRLLTTLYLWMKDDKIKTLSDQEIIADLKESILHINTMTGDSKAILAVKILERNRVDDLIY